MDETALSLGTIDVSYLSTSAECSVSRCKHSNEEWVSKNTECSWSSYLFYFFKFKLKAVVFHFDDITSHALYSFWF